MSNIKNTISYDGKSYMINGRRIWLVCGEMHYFRTPRELWRDRFEKAKQNGINCISTYMAWNFHEPEMNQYDFSGDKDIEEYVRLAGDCGLYIVLRPGPYICSEWDFGGFPAYLNTLPGIEFRTYNKAYKERYTKYLKQILPALSRQDAAHGGNIILIQNENEHIMPNLKGRREYFADLSQLYKDCGFEVPIINCNRMFEGPYDSMIECVNTWDNPIEDIDAMRSVQPGAPILITELWCGGCDAWGQAHTTKPPEEVYRKTLLITAYGGQYTYYMWHGGTNFGFYGGRLQYGKAWHMITSYDLDSPLHEGGIIGRKYNITGLVNLFSNAFGPILSQMQPKKIKQDMQSNGWEALALIHQDASIKTYMADSAMANLSPRDTNNNNNNNNNVAIKTNRFGAAMLLTNIRLDEGHILNSANLLPLWLSGNDQKTKKEGPKEIIFYGEVGQSANISINQSKISYVIEKGLKDCRQGDWLIRICDTDTALAARLINNQLCFDMQAQNNNDEALPRLSFVQKKIDNPEDYTYDPLSNLELLGEENSLEALGQPYGYAWYKINIQSQQNQEKTLCFPYSEDRLTIYQNKGLTGIYGAMDEYQGVPVALSEGSNALYVLCDNLGRMTHAYKIGEKKGIYGPPYYRESISISEPEIVLLDTPPEAKLIDWQPDWRLRHAAKIIYNANITKGQSLYIYAELACSVILHINGRDFGTHQNPNRGFMDCVIPDKALVPGENTIAFTVLTDEPDSAIRKLIIYGLSPIGNYQIAFAPWEDIAALLTIQGATLSGPVSNYPCWYRANFNIQDVSKPIFIKFKEGIKGQLYINGHNAGRVWSGVPQTCYYLPECWLESQNNIILYSESGNLPQDCAALTHTPTWLDSGEEAVQFDVV